MTTIRFNFDDFLARSDLNAEELYRVLDALPNYGWIAGGAVRRTLIGMSLDSDFDFFFRNENELEKFEAELPATLKLVRETVHHKHWRGVVEGSDLPIDVQAIKFKWYDTAEDVIRSFDYTITMFALDDSELVTTPDALWDLGRKKLALNQVTYPVATMRRMLKYTRQGFTACAGCMADLFVRTATNPEAMAELDTEYVD